MTLAVPIPVRWSGLLALTAGAVLGFLLSRPAPYRQDRVDGFSVERVLAHLRVIAQEPHPVGSRAHQNVRDYLVRELRGLDVEVSEQRSSVTSHQMGHTLGATVHNVLARIPGRVPGERAVLLDAHYDSAPGSPGASDNGVWVAALLETARVLATRPRVRRDVYLLFSDAEELGLLGAAAFVRENPAAQRIGLVLNYEARGTRGSVLMYQTSPRNGDLVRGFGDGVVSPHANSLFSTLSKLLPNDSNASRYQAAGWRVLGFALAEGVENYHRFTDTPEELGPTTLAQVGPHTLGLARYFAERESLPEPRADAVYFDLAGRSLVVYSPGWAAALGSASALAWMAIVLGRLRAGRVTSRGLRRGVWIQVGVLVLAPLVVILSGLVSSACVDLFSWCSHAPWLGLGCLLVPVGVYLHLMTRALARHSARELALGGLFASVGIGVVLGWFVPGASPSWQWPLLPALVAWGLEGRIEERWPGAARWALGGSVAIAACWLAPVVVTSFEIAGPTMLVFPVAMVISNAPLLLPPFGSSPWPRHTGPAVAAVGLVLVMTLTAFDALRGPASRTDSLVYGQDTATSSARYFSCDSASDSWVRKLVPPESTAEVLPAFVRSPEPLRQVPAGVFPLPAVEIDAKTVHSDDRSRIVEVRVRSQSRARCLRLWQTGGPEIDTIAANAKPVERLVRFSPELDEVGFKLLTGDRSPRGYDLGYCGMGEEPLLLALEVMGPSAARLRLVEEIDSLPTQARDLLGARPAGVGPAGLIGFSDVTLVSRVLVL